MVRMLAHGISSRVMAERLALDEDNLRASLDSIFAKLAISGQLGLLTGLASRDGRSNFADEESSSGPAKQPGSKERNAS